MTVCCIGQRNCAPSHSFCTRIERVNMVLFFLCTAARGTRPCGASSVEHCHTSCGSHVRLGTLAVVLAADAAGAAGGQGEGLGCGVAAPRGRRQTTSGGGPALHVVLVAAGVVPFVTLPRPSPPPKAAQHVNNPHAVSRPPPSMDEKRDIFG